LTVSLYRSLLRRALERYSDVSLLEYVNLFSTEDMVQEFVASRKYRREDDNAYVVLAFDQFMSEKVRDAKRRRRNGPQVTNSQNRVIDNFPDGYREDDLIDGYVHRRGAMWWRVEREGEELGTRSCRDGAGNVDYGVLHEEIVREMLKHDRALWINDPKRHRCFRCGNLLAIPYYQWQNARKR